MIGLGLIGPEFGKIRKLMMANLSGDSSWRFGKPEKGTPIEAEQEAVPAPDAAEDAPAGDAPVYAISEEDAALAAEDCEVGADD